MAEETGLTRISHYRIIDKLRSSELGDVYLGRDERLGRPVAVKILPASFQYDAERRSKLLKDAGLAAGLGSPNAVLIYDVGDYEGSMFVVMEYVDGEPIERRLQHGGISVPEAVDIAIQVADTLNEAHSLGLVHGDIRTANLIMTKSGLVKVLDFGISRLSGGARWEEQNKALTTRIGRETVADFMSGSVSYVSPEQALGLPIDGRADARRSMAESPPRLSRRSFIRRPRG
jgi:serine/threonine-protein kinase